MAGRVTSRRFLRRFRCAGASLILAAAFAPAAPAQCTPLTGACPVPGWGPATLVCGPTPPAVGNALFQLSAIGFPAGSTTAELVVGLCAPPPLPALAFASLCLPTWPGCGIAVDLFGWIAVPAPVCGPGGCLPVWPIPIPGDPALVDATVCAQAVVHTSTAPGACTVTTNGVKIVVLP